jgi:hypothetical protein
MRRFDPVVVGVSQARVRAVAALDMVAVGIAPARALAAARGSGRS